MRFITKAAAVEEALVKGIPMYFLAEADVVRHRWYWSDKAVASVQRQGDLVSVVFRRERVSVPIIECVETNRISRIDNDGVVHYERNCRVIG